MQVNSLVECIFGIPGLLEEGSIYTVIEVKPKGIRVSEAEPPSPHTGFYKWRFKELQVPTNIESILNEIQIKELC